MVLISQLMTVLQTSQPPNLTISPQYLQDATPEYDIKSLIERYTLQKNFPVVRAQKPTPSTSLIRNPALQSQI